MHFRRVPPKRSLDVLLIGFDGNEETEIADMMRDVGLRPDTLRHSSEGMLRMMVQTYPSALVIASLRRTKSGPGEADCGDPYLLPLYAQGKSGTFVLYEPRERAPRKMIDVQRAIRSGVEECAVSKEQMLGALSRFAQQWRKEGYAQGA